MKFSHTAFLLLFFYSISQQFPAKAQPGSDPDDNNCYYRFLYLKEKEKTESLKEQNAELKFLIKEKEPDEISEFPQFKEEPIKKILELGARIYVLQTSINRSLNFIDSLKSENIQLRSSPVKDEKLTAAKDSLIKNYESMLTEQKTQVTLLEEQLNLANRMVQKLIVR